MNTNVVRAVLKPQKVIIDFFINNCGDINDADNKFYISIAGKQITLNGYCTETDSFTCLEYSDYEFPAVFISNIVVNSINSEVEYNNKEIGNKFGCTAENIRKICNNAIAKIQKIVSTSQIEFV